LLLLYIFGLGRVFNCCCSYCIIFPMHNIPGGISALFVSLDVLLVVVGDT